MGKLGSEAMCSWSLTGIQPSILLQTDLQTGRGKIEKILNNLEYI